MKTTGKLVSLLPLGMTAALLAGQIQTGNAADLPRFDSSSTSAPAPGVSAPSPRSTSAAYTSSMSVLDDRRPLSVGDRVSLRVVEDRKPPVETFVTDSGDMEVPLIGRVKASGKTCKGLAQ